jgi:hypothetical protein
VAADINDAAEGEPVQAVSAGQSASISADEALTRSTNKMLYAAEPDRQYESVRVRAGEEGGQESAGGDPEKAPFSGGEHGRVLVVDEHVWPVPIGSLPDQPP